MYTMTDQIHEKIDRENFEKIITKQLEIIVTYSHWLNMLSMSICTQHS